MFDRRYKLNLVARRRHAQRCLPVCALDDLKGGREKNTSCKKAVTHGKRLYAVCSCVSIRMHSLLRFSEKETCEKKTDLHDYNLSTVPTSIKILLLLLIKFP